MCARCKYPEAKYYSDTKEYYFNGRYYDSMDDESMQQLEKDIAAAVEMVEDWADAEGSERRLRQHWGVNDGL